MSHFQNGSIYFRPINYIFENCVLMNLKSIFFASVLFLGMACQKVEAPYELSNEKWAHILADIHISESATQHLSLSLRDSMVVLYLDQILEIHEVPKAIFEKEYERIKKDPAKLKVVYQTVTKRLSELKLKKKKEKDKKQQEGKDAKNDKVGAKKK